MSTINQKMMKNMSPIHIYLYYLLHNDASSATNMVLVGVYSVAQLPHYVASYVCTRFALPFLCGVFYLMHTYEKYL
jgi:hypothetical protein